MHIPDGFLDNKTWATLGVVSVGAVGFAIKKVSKRATEKHIPMMGVLSAFVFASQMLNFPIGGGTSGHFMGSVLVAILLGPASGVLIMTTILIIQSLIFQDGGVLALGANIFNMGVVGCIVGYYICRSINKIIGERGKFISIFIASWVSIILSATACALELAFSGTVPLKVVLPLMAGVHALIGIGEGVITVSVIYFIFKLRPDLLNLEKI
jgi:cobalt/nickel transport system permease protein